MWSVVGRDGDSPMYLTAGCPLAQQSDHREIHGTRSETEKLEDVAFVQIEGTTSRQVSAGARLCTAGSTTPKASYLSNEAGAYAVSSSKTV